MKNSISKILGIVLTLAVLAGLMIVAVPVSAAASDEGFAVVPNPVPPPSGTTTFLVAGSNITQFAQAADGLTQYAWDAGTKTLFKSTDGGNTWARTPAANGLNSTYTVTALAVSSNYANDSTLVAAVSDYSGGNAVFRSTNGGSTFGLLPGTGLSTGGTITSIAYVLDFNGNDNDMLVGLSGGTNDMYLWSTRTYVYSPQVGVGGFSASFGNVTGVAFSPNYSSDFTIFAVTENASDVNFLEEDVTAGTTVLTGGLWNNIVTYVTTTAPTSAAILIPADFDPSANNIALVGISNGVAGGLLKLILVAGSLLVCLPHQVSPV